MITQNRERLLAEARIRLARPAFDEIAPPRAPIRIPPKGDNLFPEALKRLQSDEMSDRIEALFVFERGVRETSHPAFRSLAREWLLFARAKTFGAMEFGGWDADIRNGTASWEEIWNVATAYLRAGAVDQALQVLAPGVSRLTSPFAHLRLLYCALEALLSASPAEAARAFLVENLGHWPDPVCYLSWLLVSVEQPTSLPLPSLMEHFSRLHRLLLHPITLLDPAAKYTWPDLESFGAALREAMLEDTWLLWINSHAEYHPAYYRAWQCLSELHERRHDLDRAEAALRHNVDYSLNYLRGLTEKPTQGYWVSLRSNLVRLFEFYRRQDLFDRGRDAYRHYLGEASRSWDRSVTADARLLGLVSIWAD